MSKPDIGAGIVIIGTDGDAWADKFPVMYGYQMNPEDVLDRYFASMVSRYDETQAASIQPRPSSFCLGTLKEPIAQLQGKDIVTLSSDLTEACTDLGYKLQSNILNDVDVYMTNQARDPMYYKNTQKSLILRQGYYYTSAKEKDFIMSETWRANREHFKKNNTMDPDIHMMEKTVLQMALQVYACIVNKKTYGPMADQIRKGVLRFLTGKEDGDDKEMWAEVVNKVLLSSEYDNLDLPYIPFDVNTKTLTDEIQPIAFKAMAYARKKVGLSETVEDIADADNTQALRLLFVAQYVLESSPWTGRNMKSHLLTGIFNDTEFSVDGANYVTEEFVPESTYVHYLLEDFSRVATGLTIASGSVFQSVTGAIRAAAQSIAQAVSGSIALAKEVYKYLISKLKEGMEQAWKYVTNTPLLSILYDAMVFAGRVVIRTLAAPYTIFKLIQRARLKDMAAFIHRRLWTLPGTLNSEGTDFIVDLEHVSQPVKDQWVRAYGAAPVVTEADMEWMYAAGAHHINLVKMYYMFVVSCPVIIYVPRDGAPVYISGYVLGRARKNESGKWQFYIPTTVEENLPTILSGKRIADADDEVTQSHKNYMFSEGNDLIADFITGVDEIKLPFGAPSGMVHSVMHEPVQDGLDLLLEDYVMIDDDDDADDTTRAGDGSGDVGMVSFSMNDLFATSDKDIEDYTMFEVYEDGGTSTTLHEMFGTDAYDLEQVRMAFTATAWTGPILASPYTLDCKSMQESNVSSSVLDGAVDVDRVVREAMGIEEKRNALLKSGLDEDFDDSKSKELSNVISTLGPDNPKVKNMITPSLQLTQKSRSLSACMQWVGNMSGAIDCIDTAVLKLLPPDLAEKVSQVRSSDKARISSLYAAVMERWLQPLYDETNEHVNSQQIKLSAAGTVYLMLQAMHDKDPSAMPHPFTLLESEVVAAERMAENWNARNRTPLRVPRIVTSKELTSKTTSVAASMTPNLAEVVKHTRPDIDSRSVSEGLLAGDPASTQSCSTFCIGKMADGVVGVEADNPSKKPLDKLKLGMDDPNPRINALRKTHTSRLYTVLFEEKASELASSTEEDALEVVGGIIGDQKYTEKMVILYQCARRLLHLPTTPDEDALSSDDLRSLVLDVATSLAGLSEAQQLAVMMLLLNEPGIDRLVRKVWSGEKDDRVHVQHEQIDPDTYRPKVNTTLFWPVLTPIGCSQWLSSMEKITKDSDLTGVATILHYTKLKTNTLEYLQVAPVGESLHLSGVASDTAALEKWSATQGECLPYTTQYIIGPRRTVQFYTMQGNTKTTSFLDNAKDLDLKEPATRTVMLGQPPQAISMTGASSSYSKLGVMDQKLMASFGYDPSAFGSTADGTISMTQPAESYGLQYRPLTVHEAQGYATSVTGTAQASSGSTSVLCRQGIVLLGNEVVLNSSVEELLRFGAWCEEAHMHYLQRQDQMVVFRRRGVFLPFLVAANRYEAVVRFCFHNFPNTGESMVYPTPETVANILNTVPAENLVLNKLSLTIVEAEYNLVGRPTSKTMSYIKEKYGDATEPYTGEHYAPVNDEAYLLLAHVHKQAVTASSAGERSGDTF